MCFGAAAFKIVAPAAAAFYNYDPDLKKKTLYLYQLMWVLSFQ